MLSVLPPSRGIEKRCEGPPNLGGLKEPKAIRGWNCRYFKAPSFASHP